MIRRRILPRAHPIFLLAAIALMIPAPGARSQDRATQDRLDRLEKDLSMLQRQVYRGGSAQIASVGSSAAVDAELRMDRLETGLRELTGRVEDMANQVEQLRNRLEQINSDIDVRFGQGQPRAAAPNSHASAGMSDTGASGPVAMRGPAPDARPTRSQPPAELMPPGALVPPGALGPPPADVSASAGTFMPPGPTQRKTELATAGTGVLRPPSKGSLPTGSASEQYNVAFGLLKQADYPAAEEALKAFIARYPKDPLAGSAQYWLGETYYARGKYTEAASAFAEGYKKYPKGVKAPDDLLKLAMSLARADQKQNACIAFAQLDREFPHPGSAIKERAMTEKKRLGC
jgi:tol-pal system protein YbgF